MTEDIDPLHFEQLDRAFIRLRPKHQEMILLARVDGLTYAEIAERLGITMGEVERRMAGAIYSLDRALERQERPWWRFW